MSTRCYISDGKNYIYCHNSGYLGGVGRMLYNEYRDIDKIKALMSLGDISVLGERLTPDPNSEHSFDNPQEGVTVAYHRDRGEELIIGNYSEASFNSLDENLYLYDKEKGSWLFRSSVEERFKEITPALWLETEIKILASHFAEDIAEDNNMGTYIDAALDQLIEDYVIDPELKEELERIYEKEDLYHTFQREVTRYIKHYYLNQDIVKKYFDEYEFNFYEYDFYDNYNKMEKLKNDFLFYVKLDEAFDNLVLSWVDNEKSLLNDVIDYTLEKFNPDKDRLLEFLQNPSLEEGSVSELTYYSDTNAFYEKHKEEINMLLSEFLCDCDMSITDLRGWDKEDPLALEEKNQNTLAWFGFEEKARQLADEMYDILKNL